MDTPSARRSAAARVTLAIYLGRPCAAEPHPHAAEVTNQEEAVRFGISHVLDAIERRLSTDPTAVGGVVDLAEVVRLADLDGGRPAYSVRLGLVIDALARHLGDGTIRIYAIADRALISDTDLTANERMVVRRWSDDGHVEVLRGGPAATLRAREVAALTGLPLISRHAGGYPGLAYTPVPGPQGAQLVLAVPGPGPAAPAPVLGRQWRCPEPSCPGFSSAKRSAAPDIFGAAPDILDRVSQSPPQLAGGVPHCPRHGTPLADLGPRPRLLATAIRVAGVSWHRFVLTEGVPVVIGRAPEEVDGIGVGLALDDRGLRWVSRSHVRLELRGHAMQATDISTNGTRILVRSGPGEPTRRTELSQGQSATLGEWDTVELYEGIEIGRADRSAGPPLGSAIPSVMTDAPTQSIRMPAP